MNRIAHGGVVEMIHGVEVRDPYRWLEDRQLPATEEWIGRQRQLCDQYFCQNRYFHPLREGVSHALSVEIIDQAVRVGNKLFLKKQMKGQDRAAIWVCGGDGLDGRVLVDPAEIGANVSVEILRISNDGLLLAFSVRESGTDAMAVRVANVASGELLPDLLPHCYLRGFTFDTQNSGFYYSLEPLEPNDSLSILHHQLSEPLSADVSLFSIPRKEHRQLGVCLSGRTLVATVTELAGVELIHDLYSANQNEHSTWTPLYRGLRGRLWPILGTERVFFFEQEEAVNGRLIEWVNRDTSPRVVVPERPGSIQRVAVVRNGFLVAYVSNRQPHIEYWSFEGDQLGSISLPAGGGIEVLPLCSEVSSSLFFHHESYVDAPSLWEVDLNSPQWRKPIQRTASPEKSSAVVHECWYASSDGTRIPMVLLEPQRKLNSGPRPFALFGYGGFGTSELPRYSRLAKLLTDLGVSVARPGIRGGAEFGEHWHQAAVGRRKQTSIDDFVAATQWLIDEGVADPHRLAAIGNSNGGLLVTAAAVQRPDLFRAVLSAGPLADMVRYEQFDHASRWRREYGTVEDANDFHALFAYSPYHHIHPDVSYPAVLFISGDADDRCNPAHARKMIAALQGCAAQLRPILLDYAADWGHVPTLSFSERIEAVTRKMAFLCQELDVDAANGGSRDVFGN